MDKVQLVELLCELDAFELKEFDAVCKHKIESTLKRLNVSFEEVTQSFDTSALYNLQNASHSIDWQFAYLNLYILQLLNKELSKSDDEILSVQQTRKVKNCLQTLLTQSIYSKIQPNLPFYTPNIQKDPIENYNILKTTIYILNSFIKLPDLRLIILPDCLKAILVALYQIAYCPLKKSYETPELQSEKLTFLNILQALRLKIHPAIFIKETMILFQSQAPNWFKKAVSLNLTSMLLSKNGVENIAVAMLAGIESDDSTKTWQIVDVLVRLIMTCRNLPKFDEVVQQVVAMGFSQQDSLIYERIFVRCAQALGSEDENVCLDEVLLKFKFFIGEENYLEDDWRGFDLEKYVRLIYGIFMEKQKLDLGLLKGAGVVGVLFRFYVVTLREGMFKATNGELKEILLKCLSKRALQDLLFDDSFTQEESFLKEESSPNEEILPFRKDLLIKVQDNRIQIKTANHTVKTPFSESATSLKILLENRIDLKVDLFTILLKNLSKLEQAAESRPDLLALEEQFHNSSLARKLTVYQLLSELAEETAVQRELTAQPEEIVKYTETVLLKALAKDLEPDCDHFHTLFTIIMIVQALVNHNSNVAKFESLMGPLESLAAKCDNNRELRELIQKILNAGRSEEDVIENVALDRAIQDVCDPLLPVRGHGLMTLAKLVESKDKHVMERKQYVLNLFQQNVKNEDSFIYLNAIRGLAAMADSFPDTVLEVLCEEFIDFSGKSAEDGHEVRMKLGEVLVRVTQMLGEMAPKYKSQLLNTFLLGAKDDDDLIRASSLSNLAEICRILGYKLGNFVTEVVVCVHAIIATDKSLEARRAAVTVIRQLFVGLDSEMIAFLKDVILPIYRTLKQIYQNDRDDVMRLQAQLALEELNATMKDFVFPQPALFKIGMSHN